MNASVLTKTCSLNERVAIQFFMTALNGATTPDKEAVNPAENSEVIGLAVEESAVCLLIFW